MILRDKLTDFKNKIRCPKGKWWGGGRLRTSFPSGPGASSPCSISPREPLWTHDSVQTYSVSVLESSAVGEIFSQPWKEESCRCASSCTFITINKLSWHLDESIEEAQLDSDMQLSMSEQVTQITSSISTKWPPPPTSDLRRDINPKWERKVPLEVLIELTPHSQPPC